METTVGSLIGTDTIDWKGHTYTLGPIVPAIEAQFEQRCERLEIQGIERRQDDVSPLMFSMLISAHLNTIGSRKWAWRGLPCLEARTTDEGRKDLYFYMFEFYNPMEKCAETGRPQLTRKDMEAMWEDENFWRVLRAKMDRLADPNRSAPTPTADQS